MYKEIFSKIRREEIVDMTQKLIQIPVEYNDRDFSTFDYKPMADFMVGEFKKWGMETQILGKPGFPNPIGRLRGTEGRTSLLVTGHYNTVAVGDRSSWTHDPFGGEIVGDKIYGLGAIDMKGYIAASMVAIKSLVESGVKLKGDIIAMYHAGEGAFEHSINWLAEKHPKAIKADWCIGCEGNLPVAGIGLMWVEILTKGKSEHTPAVKPKPGIRNALSYMLKLLTSMEKIDDWMTWEPDPMFGPEAKPVCSVTMLEAGDKVNQIPYKARSEVDIRFLPNQSKEGILKELNALIENLKAENPGFGVESIDVYHHSWPFKIAEDHYLITTIQDVVEEVFGYRPEPTTSGGGVLPALARMMPVGLCGFSPKLPDGRKIGGGMHGIDEWVSIDSLVGMSKMFAALYNKLLR